MSSENLIHATPISTTLHLVHPATYVGELYAFTGTTAAVHVHAFQACVY